MQDLKRSFSSPLLILDEYFIVQLAGTLLDLHTSLRTSRRGASEMVNKYTKLMKFRTPIVGI